jgi:sec-independent protein translocase protein TatC
MRKLLRAIGRLLRGIWRVLTAPARAIGRAVRFLREEPEDQPLTDAFTTTVKHPSALVEHVNALRKHLMRMLIALVVGVSISAGFSQQLMDWLAEPVGGIGVLQAIEVTESVGVFMRVALLGGVALALPYIAFEMWLFAAPGLRARARQMGLVGIPLTLIFFLGGMAFAYYLLLPTALPFLLNFMGIATVPRLASYVQFTTGLLFWIGVAFEFPLVIYVLSLMGFVKPGMLLHNWRYAIIIIAIVAAAVTPTVDPVNMSLVMAPMIVLFFMSIGLSQMAVLGRRRRAEAQA